jgi:hypothetical protein
VREAPASRLAKLELRQLGYQAGDWEPAQRCVASENDQSFSLSEENQPVLRLQSRLPRRVPELSPGTVRRGRGRKPRVARGPRTVLLATPGESEERRIKAATGPPFFWILFFGGAKKSISPSGARPRFN